MSLRELKKAQHTELPLSVAKKLLLLLEGERIPGSQVNKVWLNMLQNEGIIYLEQAGRTKTRLALVSEVALKNFLRNRFGISDLAAYVNLIQSAESSGLEAAQIASDTKFRGSRTFKGFLITTIAPIQAKLKGFQFTIAPHTGMFSFVYDYEDFEIERDVLIIGVENPESFRHINRHKHLLPKGDRLFIARYPQNGDVIRWLNQTENRYLHFGDLDLAGLAIFEHEYRKHLGKRATYLIPPDVEKLINEKGSRKLYNKQYNKFKSLKSGDEKVQNLIEIIHSLKKGLEQESLV